jgi:hypothetical protein
MRRTVMITLFALFPWSSTIGGGVFAQESQIPGAVPSVERRLAPQVEQLAGKLGVPFYSAAAIDPRGGVRRLLGPLQETVSGMDFGPEDSMMELVLRGFVAELHAFAAGGDARIDRATVSIERVATALSGVTSILVERSAPARVRARSVTGAVASAGTGSISGTVTRHGTARRR